ncbi:hypothetical protein [Leptospira levettii]|uniref:hypothetical protein n=1 Tax=Leptospira levettii TaxID=2023178 RepID=UPI00223CF126|nr:hypothetical protein [Leptospira levettii]MCW7474736.1 hypothetical protein [Leptospira levettii]
MKSKIKFKTISTLTLQFFLILGFLIQCTLDLNNPKDPRSRSFFETTLWEEYLRGLCNADLRGTIRFGSGTYKIYPYQLLKLKNGNLIVTAGVFEPVTWNGNSVGKNFSYSGTQGTDVNAIIFLINGKSFQVEWLDYLGIITVASDDRSTVPAVELSNGDIVTSAYVKSASQGNPISSKSNANSLHMVRYDQRGNRVWNTYLDKSDNSIVESRFVLVTDEGNNIHFFFNGIGISMTPDTVGFGEFPSMVVPSDATNTGNQEIGWGVISQAGTPIKQRYLPSYGQTIIKDATYVGAGTILIFGGSVDNYVGYTGHPLPSYNFQRPMVTKLSISNFDMENTTYLGTNSTNHTLGYISEAISASDGVYTSGVSAGDFGTSFHSFQLYSGTTSFRNAIFSKFDRNGNLIWNQFLGSTISDIVEIAPKLSYVSSNNLLKAYTFSPESGALFTGFSIPITGKGINPYQKTTLNIAGGNGYYQSIHYETGFFNFPPTSTDLVNNVAVVKESCGGRLVRLQNTIDLNTEIGTMEVTTRPAYEEP